MKHWFYGYDSTPCQEKLISTNLVIQVKQSQVQFATWQTIHCFKAPPVYNLFQEMTTKHCSKFHQPPATDMLVNVWPQFLCMQVIFGAESSHLTLLITPTYPQRIIHLLKGDFFSIASPFYCCKSRTRPKNDDTIQ